MARRASAVAFALYAAFLVASALLRPLYNWDLVVYTEAALAGGRAPDAALHARTWALLRERLPPQTFTDLTTGPYRQAQLQDPASLASMLPLARVKPGYVGLLALLEPVLDPVRATQLLAAVGALLLALVTFRAARRLEGPLALTWLPLLGAADAVELARLATPDALATGLVAAGLALLLGRRPRAGVALLLAGLLVRPDNLPLHLALAAALAPGAAREAGALALGSLALAAGASAWAHPPGWWALVSFATIQQPTTLVGYAPAFDAGQYLGVLGRCLRSCAELGWPYAALAAGLGALHRLRGDALGLRLLAAVSGSALLKLLLFPSPAHRLFAPYLVGLGLLLLEGLPRAEHPPESGEPAEAGSP